MGKFLQVECSGCGNVQAIFNRPSSVVKCTACGKTVAKPTGGKGEILCKIKRVLG